MAKKNKNNSRNKGCGYMKVNPLDPRKKTTVKGQKANDIAQRENNYFEKMANSIFGR